MRIKRTWLTLLLCAVVAIPPGLAQTNDKAPSTTATTIQKQSINFETALAVAKAALKAGHATGHAISVTVADNAGLPLVILREDNATEQFLDGSRRRAWTSVTMKNSTRDLVELVKAGKQDDALLPFIDKSLLLMGGVPLKLGEAIVGAVGVSGCPFGPDDDAVAQAGAAEFARLSAK